MKVLSLLQPFATLVVIGAKKIETRSWDTKYRGQLLIHASKKYTKDQYKLAVDFNTKYGTGLECDHLPVGQIIGSVNLIETFPTEKAFAGAGGIGFKTNDKVVVGDELRMMLISIQEGAFGDYSPGRYGWLLSNPIKFKNCIPAKGYLGLWDFPGINPEPSHAAHREDIGCFTGLYSRFTKKI
jgi:activating signal cointegrator 1